MEWVRFDDLIEAKHGGSMRPQLFEDGIRPTDVSQGGIGDCWLMSAFAAIAEFPEVVQSIYITKRYNAYGKYKLRLFDPNEQDWYEEVVDNYIPCRDGKTPIYAGASDEMWVVLLEKAVAKYCGSYANLNGGRTEWALHFLTGYPVFIIHSDGKGGKWRRSNMHVVGGKEGKARRSSSWQQTDETFSVEDVFYILREYDEKNAIMCCESPGGDDTDISDNGIVQGHAYTLLGATKVDDFLLVHVRNPWGRGEWKGDWSDESSLWERHPSVNKELKFEASNDGAFWMTIQDFCANFDALTVCPRETGFTDLALDPHEHLGCCGVCVGCFCGCASYWCCCKGCKALCCGEEADDATVKGKRDGCCPCCPRV